MFTWIINKSIFLHNLKIMKKLVVFSESISLQQFSQHPMDCCKEEQFGWLKWWVLSKSSKTREISFTGILIVLPVHVHKKFSWQKFSVLQYTWKVKEWVHTGKTWPLSQSRAELLRVPAIHMMGVVSMLGEREQGVGGCYIQLTVFLWWCGISLLVTNPTIHQQSKNNIL